MAYKLTPVAILGRDFSTARRRPPISVAAFSLKVEDVPNFAKRLTVKEGIELRANVKQALDGQKVERKVGYQANTTGVGPP